MGFLVVTWLQIPQSVIKTEQVRLEQQSWYLEQSNVDKKVANYLNKYWAWQYIDSFKKYWEMFGIKQELVVCIANSETSLWKHTAAKGNIGNINVYSHRSFVLADGNPDWDRGIKAIFQAGLNGRYMIHKKIVWDLYTNGNCKNSCKSFYAMGKNAEGNVLRCLSSIYGKKIWANFRFRK